MLWSDPRDEPSHEGRASLAMLRRLSWLLPVVIVIALALANLR